METLPPEILEMILKQVSYETIPSACLVSKRWAALCPNFRNNKHWQRYYKSAVRIYITKKKGLKICAIKAAEHDYYDLLRLYCTWKTLSPTRLLQASARGGSLRCMKFAKELGLTKYEWALDSALCTAARNGNPECMKLAKEWGATNFEEALSCAAHNGYPICLKLAKEWGAENYKEALDAITCHWPGAECLGCKHLLFEWCNE